ncbi:hypothetical protein LSH36_99g03012 [Paralvinella palmiformis]|uniref:Ig-like domain-containing protein n=1 Tax=Paralvinella palmiformis TaxID=53620 RepID=A0AAD9K0F4_9ANNE|nr:hypothetical protein LSH36_99g03012 [Paralvinella palmiformis]
MVGWVSINMSSCHQQQRPRMSKNGLIGVFIFICQFSAGSFFSMLSRGQQLVLDVGDDVTLQCEFYMESFNLFYNPILWRKIQYDESLELNIMGNIKDPFEATDKFKVTFNPLPPRYMLGLYVGNLTHGDSGNYTCEVRGPSSRLLGQVIHTIYIRTAILEVAIYKDSFTGDPRDVEHLDSEKSISFIENYRAPLMCVVRGGNPPPEVDITLGLQEVTDVFHVTRYRKVIGRRGFRIVRYTTVLWTEQFVAGPEDDGVLLYCDSSVQGLDVVRANSMVKVYYGPTITCESAAAYVGDKNVYLSCNVRARPSLTVLFWMLDGNGTVVSEGEVVNEYWIINMARLDSFRTYTLVAENNVGVTTQNVQLRRLFRDTRPRPHSVDSQGQKYHSATNRIENRPGYVFIRNAAGGRERRYYVICVIYMWTISVG